MARTNSDHRRIKPYNPVKKAPKVPKGPQLPTFKSKRAGYRFPGIVWKRKAEGGPFHGFYINLPWDSRTLTFRAGSWTGYYSSEDRNGGFVTQAMWVDVS